jgi:hypothetical protein
MNESEAMPRPTMPRPTMLRLVPAALFVLATVLFVVGTQSEQSSEAKETRTQHVQETGNEGQEHAAATGTHSASSEKVLGLRVESTGTQVVAVLVSVAAIAALMLARRRAGLAAVGAIAALFVVLDVAEVVHQADRSESGLAVLAAAVALLHAGVAVGAVAAARDVDRAVPRPAIDR